AAPTSLSAPSDRTALTSVQIVYNGVSSPPVEMPFAPSLPGLLSRDLLDLQLHPTFPDGFAQNEDGSMNDADHPAAVGSKISVFATGLGATTPPSVAGAIAKSAVATPLPPVFASWRSCSFRGPNPPEAVFSVPGFVSSLFQILVQVPASV